MTAWPRTVGGKMLQRALITAGIILMLVSILGCATTTPFPSGQPTPAPIGCEVLRQRAPGEC